MKWIELNGTIFIFLVDGVLCVMLMELNLCCTLCRDRNTNNNNNNINNM